MTTPDNLPASILRHLHRGPMTCNEITRALNADERWSDMTVFRVRPWLLTMKETGEIIEHLDGRYGLSSGGYTPDPEAA